MSKYIINVSFQTRVNKTRARWKSLSRSGLAWTKKSGRLRQSGAGSEAGRCGVHHRPTGSGKSVVLRELQRQMKDEGCL